MHIFQTGLGVGDVLMATGVLRAWRRVNNYEKVIVASRYPELFWNNPDVFLAYQEKANEQILKLFSLPFIWRVNLLLDDWRKKTTLKPTYPFPAPGRHIIDSMAATLGITLLPEERHPFIYLSPKELVANQCSENTIVVQSSSTTFWTPNKNWIPGRMQQVVNYFYAKKFKIIQLGTLEDEPLDHVTDLRGKVTMRQGAAILANAHLFIGLEGGLVHTARAVGTTSVVVYTGYTTPFETGYPENINLRSHSAEDGCWCRTPCDHCKKSAEAIQIADVAKAAEIVLNYRIYSSDNDIQANIRL